MILNKFRQNEETWRHSAEINIEISEPTETPDSELELETPPKKLLSTTKHAWESEEQDDDILDRFLKVKKFADNRMASYESKWYTLMSCGQSFKHFLSINYDSRVVIWAIF